MRTLHLLRHAKSSAKKDIEDHERPLSRKGREAAQHLGNAPPAIFGAIDLVLCSSAVRTRETLDLIIAGLSPRPRSVVEDELYLATREKLMRRLTRLDDADEDGDERCRQARDTEPRERIANARVESPYTADWQLQSSFLVREGGNEISTTTFHPRQWFPAAVPTTVLGALVKNGVYPDLRVTSAGVPT